MELQEFVGMLSSAGWSDKIHQVAEYTLRFNKEPSDVGQHLAQVTISIVKYLLEDVPDPIAWRVIELPMPFFHVGTQLALAQEFGDKKAVEILTKQINQIREEIGS
jgi:hypothetical protein